MTALDTSSLKAVSRGLALSYLRRNVALAIPFVATIVVFSCGAIWVGGFSSGASLTNIFALTAILAVVAGAQTLVIIGGGIDLSVPWVITGSGILTSYLTNGHSGRLVWVIPLVCALAAAVGVGNGLGIMFLSVPPIVMTLAMNVVLSGAVVIYAEGHSSQGTSPGALTRIFSGHVAGVPGYVVVLIVTTLLLSVLLSFTRIGRRLYAVGAGLDVARLSGVNVRSVIVVSYALSSVAAACSGMLLLGYVNNAFFGMGDPYLFTSISAVVVGGASILGGSGHFLGTLGGALLLTVANALLIVLNLGPGAISIFYGLIILLSVILLSDRIGSATRRGGALARSLGGP